jgi:hypothetical protein
MKLEFGSFETPGVDERRELFKDAADAVGGESERAAIVEMVEDVSFSWEFEGNFGGALTKELGKDG